MFATSPLQNTTTAVPAWVPDALVSHTQNSEYLAELLDLSVTAGNAAVFSTIRTLHGTRVGSTPRPCPTLTTSQKHCVLT